MGVWDEESCVKLSLLFDPRAELFRAGPTSNRNVSIYW
jgi:hypothetical protein